MRIAIINGVNLGQLGTREVNIYGAQTFEEYFKELERMFPEVELTYFQSDKIEELVDALRKGQSCDGIILNPGAFTHTAIVLADTIRSISTPVIEVHISNLFGRELYRRRSVIAAHCAGFISGFGLQGYALAIHHFAD
ncbi:MAG: 3-dehydroquinate dehydratase [Bacteroidales bacterium]|jgi:3-dehydroquinate dehydratase-2|nr:3-dehydroquinate dehydratase [Bacteroidales bacterium]